MIAKSKPRAVRCGIYCRKSVANGLEKEFNSIDAQREACEAYVVSKKHEGFLCLPDRYDDGGFSGATTERPGLKKLLEDIEAGKVNCVVVQRIDRLSRSLSDFCRLAELFERHGVAFISVTQSLDTSSPMGRFTLNILFSFAEFEREMICARTKDKVAAARRKGRWTGGTPILGYDVAPEGGKLIENKRESERVRAIFDLYLEHQGLIETVKALTSRAWKRKRWTTKTGRKLGGSDFDKGSLHRLLTNPAYLGKTTYKGEVFEGEHPAIVDGETFQRVQRLLKRNGHGRNGRNSSNALLKGLLFCAPCNAAMTPARTRKGSKEYRYYCCIGAQKRGWKTCPSKSVPAGEIEGFVVDQVRCIGKDPALRAEVLRQIQSHTEKERRAVKAEARRLERALKRHSAAVSRLVAQGAAAAQVAVELEKTRLLEAKLSDLKAKAESLERNALEAATVERVLSKFNPVWETLTAAERGQVLRLLIKRIDYDGEKGTIAVEFHETGLQALSEQIATDEAAA